MRSVPKLASIAAVAAIALTLAACAGAPAEDSDSSAGAAEKTSLKIGFNPGPYEDMFNAGILPILEKDGYSVEAVDFTDGVIVNQALSDGEIDANIMQHSVFMDSINEQEGLTNVSLVQVPGPPMALFGGKKKSLDDVADGSTVAVPNQPSNMYRAFQVLADVGWIELRDSIDPATASPADVTSNKHNLQFVTLENAQQVPALQDVDYDVIQGNFVVSGGLDLGDALFLEDLTDEFSVIVAVDEKNADSDWAKAIKAAYESPEFAEYIKSNSQYDGYNLPAALES